MAAPRDPHCSSPGRLPATPFLVPTTTQHGPSCGERCACPAHGDHGLGPYLPAERQLRRDGAYVWCNRCRTAWREVAA